MRIRILDPHWKKWIRIQVISLTKQNFKIFCPIFLLLIFNVKLDEPFRNQVNFIISLFTLVQIWVMRINFFFAFFCRYFAPWIRILYFCGSRIFLRIRIHEAKIKQIQRIRILCTDLKSVIITDFVYSITLKTSLLYIPKIE